MGLRSLLSRGADEQLLKTQQETNELLRELIRATTGRVAVTKSATQSPQRIRDETDISVVTRKSVIELEQEQRSKDAAPWRETPPSGPASAPEKSIPGAPALSPALPRVVL